MKHIENKCSLRIVHNGRELTGTSAQLAHIHNCGGWDAFMRETAAEAISLFIDTYHLRLENQRVDKPDLRIVV